MGDWKTRWYNERPWLPFAGLFLLAGLFCLVAAYERDWWVFREPPHVPLVPHRVLSEKEFWEAADREYDRQEALKRDR